MEVFSNEPTNIVMKYIEDNRDVFHYWIDIGKLVYQYATESSKITKKERAVIRLALRMKDFYVSYAADTGLYGIILNWVFDQVQWQEIAIVIFVNVEAENGINGVS